MEHERKGINLVKADGEGQLADECCERGEIYATTNGCDRRLIVLFGGDGAEELKEERKRNSALFLRFANVDDRGAKSPGEGAGAI
jgi:hypothetical protein